MLVYLMESENFYKIGITSYPDKRLYELNLELSRTGRTEKFKYSYLIKVDSRDHAKMLEGGILSEIVNSGCSRYTGPSFPGYTEVFDRSGKILDIFEKYNSTSVDRFDGTLTLSRGGKVDKSLKVLCEKYRTHNKAKRLKLSHLEDVFKIYIANICKANGEVLRVTTGTTVIPDKTSVKYFDDVRDFIDPSCRKSFGILRLDTPVALEIKNIFSDYSIKRKRLRKRDVLYNLRKSVPSFGVVSDLYSRDYYLFSKFNTPPILARMYNKMLGYGTRYR